MNSVKEVFSTFKDQLTGLYEPDEIEAITLLLLTGVTALTKTQLKAFPETELTPAQSEKAIEALVRLKTGEPVQYILGHTEFYGLIFKVNPSVLIPRPETEELVEWAISAYRNRSLTGNILDIGTGSGCIAISLKKHLPEADVSAMDISPAALQTAEENAVLNNVTINFIEDDILNRNLKTYNPELAIHYSLIISNPPYVTERDKLQMHHNVTDFEPHTALFVTEDDPLIFYKAIAKYAQEHLIAGGLLFFEINESFGKETVELLRSSGFENVELRKDMSGRDRIICAEMAIQ